MSDKSAIEWTDATWNPVTGCSKVSPGCAHCYAERLAPKLFAGQATIDRVTLVERKRVFTDVRCHADRLDHPLHWKKPRRVFVNSVSDLFHEAVPDQFLHEVYHVMEHARRHTFQVLTKRAARMRAYLAWRYGPDDEHPRGRIPSRHIWHGVSVENQHFADERIPLLLQTPAAVRFISAEPLLGPVDLRRYLSEQRIDPARKGTVDEMMGCIPWLDWVIVGGESGPQSRAFDLGWARSIIAQCKDAGVACFVKQLGANPIGEFDADGQTVWTIGAHGLRDKKGGAIEEWPIDLRVREYPR